MASTSFSSTWQQTCAKVKASRDLTIASIYPPLPPIPTGLLSNVTSIPALILTPAEFAITSLPTTALLNHTSTRAVSSTTVVNAYLRRAALAQELTNCLTELLPSRALVRAQWLDDYIGEHGRTVGPLHGLPISVKEHICMEGLECNTGFVSWVGRKALDDALVLKILWDAGAVFYARTTEPQTIVSPFLSISCGVSSFERGCVIRSLGGCLDLRSGCGVLKDRDRCIWKRRATYMTLQ